MIIFSDVPSESAELERLRPRTRLVQKPYSLPMLVESLQEMFDATKRPELAHCNPDGAPMVESLFAALTR